MKNIYLSIFAVCIAFSSFSQMPKFGVKAGLISSTIKGDANNSLQSILDFTGGMVTTASRTGFYAGAFTQIPLGSGFSLEPGIGYSQKGYTMNGDFSIKGAEFIGANAKAVLQSGYIDMPLVVKANFGGLQIFAGPQISYLLKSDLKTTAGALGINLLNKSFNVTDQFNRWDAAITGGLGYQFGNGMNITASYDHGLSKIDANSNLSAYNRGFKIGIGMTF